MALSVKVGSFIYRFNPSNPKELQRRSQNSSSWSFVCSCNGYEILDLETRGNDIIMSTDHGTYIRKEGGSETKAS